jgi:hypothetical protein
MSKIEPPPLPDGKGVIRHAQHDDDGGGWIVDIDCEGPLSHQPDNGDELFTADQLRAYGEQIVEVCAQIADDMDYGMGDVGRAIRNLIEESNNG